MLGAQAQGLIHLHQAPSARAYIRVIRGGRGREGGRRLDAPKRQFYEENLGWGDFALMKKGISWLDPELHGEINSSVHENIHL